MNKSTLPRLKSDRLRFILENDPTKVEQICMWMGDIKPSTLALYLVDGTSLPTGITPYRCNADFDEVVDRGLPVRDLNGHSRESLRLHIKGSGQKDFWNSNRKRRERELQERQYLTQRLKEALKSPLESIVMTLRSIITRMPNKSWPEEMAIQFTAATASKTYPLASLIELFSRYEQATETGIQLSLKELGRGLSIPMISVARILEKVGLEPMYGKKVRTTTSREQKASIYRSFGTTLSYDDIAYFAGVNGHVVRQIYQKRGGRKTKSHPLVRFDGYQLSLRLASLTYELGDSGFSGSEICELLGTNKTIHSYITRKRGVLEFRILGALRSILDEDNIYKAYVSSKLLSRPMRE